MIDDEHAGHGDLPNFIYVGADKAGSTWLANVLYDHPACFVPTAKDMYFFTSEYWRGVAWYRSFYKRTQQYTIRAEVCHDYMYSDVAVERLARTVPDCHLGVILRHPFDRAVSSIINYRRNGARGSIEQLVCRHPDIIENSLYSAPLARLLSAFDTSQVHVTAFDTLTNEPGRLLRDMFGSLQLEFDPSRVARTRSASVARNVMLSRAVKRLAIEVRRAGYANMVGRVKHSRLANRILTTRASAPRAETAIELARLGYGDLLLRDLFKTESLVALPEVADWKRSIEEVSR